MKTVSSIQELQESMNPRQHFLVMAGCILILFSISAYGMSLSTIQMPMLTSIGAEGYFTLITVLASIALCIMTPVGGALGDKFGTRNVMAVSSIVTVAAGILLAFTSNIWMMMVLRTVLALGQGGIITGPYIIAREVNPMDQVPKYMGFLTAALSAGGFLGSYVAGLLTDMNLMWLAILLPAVFVAVGMPLIYFNLPQKELDRKPFDFAGFALLSITLITIFLALNYGPRTGWTNPWVLAGFGAGIVSLILLVITERRVKAPLLPTQLFSNRIYTLLLIIGFFSFFYLPAMNVYVPMGAQTIMGISVAASGSLQLPRTLVTVILPSFTGIWLARDPARRTWVSLAAATALVFIPFALLVFMNASMPVWFVMAMLAITGIADCFRSVSITPAAQNLLIPSQLGIGTSLLAFINSLAGVIAASVYGIAFDSVSAGGTPIDITHGVDAVFWIAAATALIGLLLSVFVFRPVYARYMASKNQQ